MALPLSIGWNVPFNEAIRATVGRGVVLPDVYYGKLQGIHRQLAFSIANVAKLDQLQAVLDSLTHSLNTGGTFANWQRNVDVKALGLPKHRLDNIFRTNIQSAYNSGHWQQQLANKSTRPYLVYDAINDSRTRPSHKANDGIIRQIDDPIWKRIWFSRNVYRCRCRLISLSEEQAIARSKNGTGLQKTETLDHTRDTAWDSVDVMNADVMTFGVERAIAKRLVGGKANTSLLSAFETQQASKPTSLIDKQAFTAWVDKVSQPEYKARHEFMQVGVLPDAVMADSDVFALTPVNNEIYISDYQLKHSQRPEKSVPLPIDILKQLPDKLESSRWFFDASHKNLIAAFDIQTSTDIGKAVLQINFFKKKKQVVNAVVTSGLIEESTLLMTIYREIFDNKP